MTRQEIIAAIDEEIDRLQQVRKLLETVTGQKFAPGAVSGKPLVKRILSPEARQRIAAAQKRRWAKHKKETALAAAAKK